MSERENVTRAPIAVAQRYRKVATIRAVRLDGPFCVDSKEGTLNGKAGDWLAIADDDSDEKPHRWIISAADFAATYVPDSSVPTDLQPTENT